ERKTGEEGERDPADGADTVHAPADAERQKAQREANTVFARERGPCHALTQPAEPAPDEDEERVDGGDDRDRGMDADSQQYQRQQGENGLCRSEEHTSELQSR